MTAARSATLLAQKLGLRRGMRCWFHNMPGPVRAALDPEGSGVEEQPTASDGLQCAHLFLSHQSKLERELAALSPLMAGNGFIWISWPLDAAEGETDLSEDTVRTAADAQGLAVGEGCTIDDRWAAMKLAVRREAP